MRRKFSLILVLVLLAFIVTGCNKSDDVTDPAPDEQAATVTTNPDIEYSRYAIILDTNKNGLINAGETIELQVYLKNTGDCQVNNVFATLSTTSSVVTLIPFGSYSKASFKDVNGNDYLPIGQESNFGRAYYYDGNNDTDYYSKVYSYTFQVSSSAAAGTSISFSLAITAAGGLSWTRDFNVMVN
ncbi:MAG: hypothetical protein PHD29_08740 [bacterium]|nr:hypothetical protein [bacterium]MDD5354245.1 hypothetical protein [bacterium]MDD5756068.1 hypothetical protein [bacterium]